MYRTEKREVGPSEDRPTHPIPLLVDVYELELCQQCRSSTHYHDLARPYPQDLPCPGS